jgi:hypothetical protein
VIARSDPIYPVQKDRKVLSRSNMANDKVFAVLVGRAFLKEIEAGHRDNAIAFGRAFLLSLGMRGPEESKVSRLLNGKVHAQHLAMAEN